MNALIVDDSRAMRMMLKRTLTELGFDVHEAKDGAEAMAQLELIGSVDLVLVDWNMPVMDGLTFVKEVRSQPTYERMRLVMVTSESEPQRILRALMAGADEYATKPITADGLAGKLDIIGLPEREQ
jgi:two-component system chemotaxis response regulator CheY